jgi:phosphopantothenoylcysteine decarboxylase / phosphopantothenate---cysteine ligase
VFAGKRIVLGVTGSIAAYKAPMLVRELSKAGAEVRVVMTPSAKEFVTPLTLATLSQSDVIMDMFPAVASQGTWHIHLGLWADAMIIAPASANTIAKLAHGFADNALTALVLALRCPLVVAPAMDADMFEHAATGRNLELLRERGVHVIEPATGELASGLIGTGRLPETHVLMDALAAVLHNDTRDLAGLSILVSAGPTYEEIDPVRYIGNYSSGKMGYAIAAAAAARGATVDLVSGPSKLPTPGDVRRFDVTSARDMHAVIMDKARASDVIVMSAAVADFRPAHRASTKLKKDAMQKGDMSMMLEPNPDILAELGAQKGRRVLIGFALETERDYENAVKKMRAKALDMIVLNNPSIDGAGFGGDTNIATFLHPDGGIEAHERMSKTRLAHVILDRVAAISRGRMP